MGLFTIFLEDRQREGVAHCRLTWVPNKALHLYLKDPALKQFSVLSLALRKTKINSKGLPVGLSYVPFDGDFVAFVQPARS